MSTRYTYYGYTTLPNGDTIKREHSTRGHFTGWQDAGLLGEPYAAFQRGSDTLLIPWRRLTSNTRAALPPPQERP